VKEQWSYTFSDTFVFYLFVDNLMLLYIYIYRYIYIYISVIKFNTPFRVFLSNK